MTPHLRRFALTTHVVSSVGWTGALAVFMAHAVAGRFSQDEQIVRAVSVAMGMTAWLVILPLSLVSIGSGLVQALGTTWGLFRHYWVVFKLLLTVVATVVLLLKLGPITALAEAAAQPSFTRGDLTGLRSSVMIHAIGGLAVLLTAATLAIYKPSGMTRYGRRRQPEQSGVTTAPELRSTTVTPIWVKVFGIIVIVLVALVAMMVLGGTHGPGYAAIDSPKTHTL